MARISLVWEKDCKPFVDEFDSRAGLVKIIQRKNRCRICGWRKIECGNQCKRCMNRSAWKTRKRMQFKPE